MQPKYSVQQTRCNMQHATDQMQHAACNIQHKHDSKFLMQHNEIGCNGQQCKMQQPENRQHGMLQHVASTCDMQRCSNLQHATRNTDSMQRTTRTRDRMQQTSCNGQHCSRQHCNLQSRYHATDRTQCCNAKQHSTCIYICIPHTPYARVPRTVVHCPLRPTQTAPSTRSRLACVAGVQYRVSTA